MLQSFWRNVPPGLSPLLCPGDQTSLCPPHGVGALVEAGLLGPSSFCSLSYHPCFHLWRQFLRKQFADWGAQFYFGVLPGILILKLKSPSDHEKGPRGMSPRNALEFSDPIALLFRIASQTALQAGSRYSPPSTISSHLSIPSKCQKILNGYQRQTDFRFAEKG